MPPNPSAKTAPKTKGKPLGIPTWGWIAAVAVGLVVGYVVLKKSGSSSAASGADQSSGAGPNPLTDQTGAGSGGFVANPSLPTSSNITPIASPTTGATTSTPTVVTEQQAAPDNTVATASPSTDLVNAVAATQPFAPLPNTLGSISAAITQIGYSPGPSTKVPYVDYLTSNPFYTSTPVTPEQPATNPYVNPSAPTVPATMPGSGAGPQTPAGSNIIGHGFVGD